MFPNALAYASVHISGAVQAYKNHKYPLLFGKVMPRQIFGTPPFEYLQMEVRREGRAIKMYTRSGCFSIY